MGKREKGVRAERLCARIEGDFVVFLIGMRVNRLWAIHRWLPVARAMPRMIEELVANPDLGFLGSESWFGRTVVMVQYWRSTEQLMAYATDKAAAHLPAWRDFNRRVGTDGSVGVFHETFPISAGGYETVYVNMPLFGLGKVAQAVPAEGRRKRAQDRLRATAEPETDPLAD